MKKQIPRFSAQEIAGVTGYHQFKHPFEMIDSYLYQDLTSLRLLDASNLALELVDESEQVEELLSKLPLDEKRIIKELQQQSNDDKTLTEPGRAKIIIDSLEKIFESESAQKLYCTEEKNIIKNKVLGNVRQKFGTVMENDGLDRYEQLTGRKVIERNSDLMCWPIYHNDEKRVMNIFNSYLRFDTQEERNYLSNKMNAFRSAAAVKQLLVSFFPNDESATAATPPPPPSSSFTSSSPFCCPLVLVYGRRHFPSLTSSGSRQQDAKEIENKVLSHLIELVECFVERVSASELSLPLQPPDSIRNSSTNLECVSSSSPFPSSSSRCVLFVHFSELGRAQRRLVHVACAGLGLCHRTISDSRREESINIGGGREKEGSIDTTAAEAAAAAEMGEKRCCIYVWKVGSEYQGQRGREGEGFRLSSTVSTCNLVPEQEWDKAVGGERKRRKEEKEELQLLSSSSSLSLPFSSSSSSSSLPSSSSDSHFISAPLFYIVGRVDGIALQKQKNEPLNNNDSSTTSQKYFRVPVEMKNR